MHFISTYTKCPEPESNQWHEDFQSSALPTELSGHKSKITQIAGAGFEPTTFGLWARRASRLLHPALIIIYYILLLKPLYMILIKKSSGWRWIRTTEAICSRFTVCPLWPLGNPSIWYFLSQADKRTRTVNLLITNQLLCQLSHIGA